jgi:hypothetical protein
MKTELAKLEIYREQLKSVKSSLTSIPDNVYQPDWKPINPRMELLDKYLSMNDCTETAAKASCYRSTRLLLITTTKELDATSARVNALNATIDRLVLNINTVIDEVSKEPDKGTRK